MIIRKIDKGVYFEHAGIWYNRVDVEVEVREANGNRFGAKARDYVIYWEADTFRSHKKMVVRYFPMFKKRVVFDPKHHGENESE